MAQTRWHQSQASPPVSSELRPSSWPVSASHCSWPLSPCWESSGSCIIPGSPLGGISPIGGRSVRTNSWDSRSGDYTQSWSRSPSCYNSHSSSSASLSPYTSGNSKFPPQKWVWSSLASALRSMVLSPRLRRFGQIVPSRPHYRFYSPGYGRG